MYDYETDDMDTLTELLEGLDSDESDDLTERSRGRSRGRGRGSVRTPSRNPSYKPQSTMDPHVRKSELAGVVRTIDEKFKIISEAATKLSARVNTVADQQERQAMALKKESAKREKDIKDICQKLELVTLIPLISGNTTRTISGNTNGLVANDKVLIESGDSLSSLLPLLLIGGCGGSGGGLGLGGGEGGSSNILLPLILLGGLGKR